MSEKYIFLDRDATVNVANMDGSEATRASGEKKG
jgi:hypothetical protein